MTATNNATYDTSEFSNNVQVPGAQSGTIGNWVWNDTNHDGQQDVGEMGVGGVVVQLLDANGNLLLTTVTASDGGYSFGSLAAGTYKVRFSAQPGNSPLVFTTPNVGNDATDSDADASTGTTGLITIASGQSNLTIDAGLIIELGPSGGGM